MIFDFTNNSDSNSFNLREKITGETNNKGRKNVQIIVSLINLSNFCRISEMPLITFEINLILTWSTNCVITSCTAVDQATTFASDTKLHVLVKAITTIETRIQLQY